MRALKAGYGSFGVAFSETRQVDRDADAFLGRLGTR